MASKIANQGASNSKIALSGSVIEACFMTIGQPSSRQVESNRQLNANRTQLGAGAVQLPIADWRALFEDRDELIRI